MTTVLTKLRNLFGREAKAADISALLLDLGARSAAGVYVSPESGLRCTPVYAAVRVIAETAGSLPVHVYRRLPNGGKERATEHPLERLMSSRPNAWTSAPEFIMALQADALTHGGGYAYANRAGDKIVELLRLPPTATVMKID